MQQVASLGRTAQKMAMLSVATSVVTLGLKVIGAWRSGSVGLFGDAAESIVNVTASIVTLLLLRWSAKPEDEGYAYGYEKGEHIAAGFEGAMIVVAAVATVSGAIFRFMSPKLVTNLFEGGAYAFVATLLNLGVGSLPVRAGKRLHSDALRADGHHLLTDVWSTAVVLVGLGATALTGLTWLDPLAAVIVALIIARTGVNIAREAATGLLDASLPKAELDKIMAVLDSFRSEHIDFHAVRTRRAGRRRFISVHVLVPGAWSVREGHDFCERLERSLEDLFDVANVTTHLEPVEDELAQSDAGLDRRRSARPAP